MVGENVDPDLRVGVPVEPSAPIALEARNVRGRSLLGADLRSARARCSAWRDSRRRVTRTSSTPWRARSDPT